MSKGAFRTPETSGRACSEGLTRRMMLSMAISFFGPSPTVQSPSSRQALKYETLRRVQSISKNRRWYTLGPHPRSMRCRAERSIHPLTPCGVRAHRDATGGGGGGAGGGVRGGVACRGECGPRFLPPAPPFLVGVRGEVGAALLALFAGDDDGIMPTVVEDAKGGRLSAAILTASFDLERLRK